MPTVLYRVEDDISIVVLNRPEKLNAFNGELIDELEAALRQADEDPQSKVIVLRGAGRAFSSGADISGSAPPDAGVEYYRARTEKELGVYRIALELKKPSVCGVHGYALGLGFGLMAACDIIIATDNAKIGTPEVRYGDSSTQWVLPVTLGRNRAMELFLTGDTVSGKEAAELGIVNRSVPEERFETELFKTARKLALIPSFALLMNKAGINEFYHVNDLKHYMEFMYDYCAIIESSKENQDQDEMRKHMPLKDYLEKIHAPFRELEK
jgi:enoyl-CoA hydratase/carnithine racemase